jgi:hypothetical protein
MSSKNIKKKKQQNKFPLGITIFGLILISDSLLHLLNQLHVSTYYPEYCWLMHPLPENMIFQLYLISILSGIAELIAGIGILFCKEICRKLALILTGFTLATLYWRMPFYFFSKQADQVIDFISWTNNSDEWFAGIDKGWVIWSSFIIVWMVNVIFSGLLIYYFTRPYIKTRFK